MGNAKSPSTESGPAARGIGGELTRLKSNASATVAELREFLGNMRQRNPHEVLGMVATSGLARSTLLATVLFAVLLGAMTAIPYYWPQSEATKPSGDQAAATAQEAAKPGPAASATPAAGSPTDPEQAAVALGIDETKPADPEKNPRETELDNLLDGIE